MSNYPDGMREGDIPGYWDIECPECSSIEDPDPSKCSMCEGTGMVDSRDSEYDPDPPDNSDRWGSGSKYDTW